MKIIQFKENQKGIWNKFVAENNSESFLQAWEWGEFNRTLGKKVWRIGIIGDGLFGEGKTKESRIKNHELRIKLLAIALVIKYDLPLGRSYLYCPRGWVICESRITNHESRVESFLFEEIGKIAREEKAVFLRFDPPIVMEHGTWNMEQNIPLPAKEGLGEVFKSPNEVQPKNTLILDLAKSEEELLKEMKSKTRYNIRLAERKELRIKNYELRTENQKQFKEKFERFWELVEETSRRDNFKSHSKNYYWQMLENLGGDEKSISKNPPSPLLQRGNSQEGNNLQAKLYLAEYENKIIAANIVLFFGDYCVYLHGASSNKYRNVMAPYLLQWRQILDAKKNGCQKYDFWGIEESQKSIKSKVHKIKNDWSGITRFKKGFGGEEKNYVGAYDIVFNKWEYRLYKIVRQIKSIF